MGQGEGLRRVAREQRAGRDAIGRQVVHGQRISQRVRMGTHLVGHGWAKGRLRRVAREQRAGRDAMEGQLVHGQRISQQRDVK